MIYIQNIIVMCIVIINAIMDIKDKTVSITICIFGGVSYIVMALLINFNEFISKNNIIDLAGGLLIGSIFIVVSVVTRESLGMGDSIVITVMGGILGIKKILVIVMISIFIGAILSLILLITHKKSRKDTIAFVPIIFCSLIFTMANSM